jgi:phosphotriesterase-related protein
MIEKMSLAPVPAPRSIVTVQGEVAHQELGITDAHNHVWISRIDGAATGSPVLDQYDRIVADLLEFRQAGGTALLDCQPGGFGRDGNQLLALSRATGVHVIACTGFHRRRYNPGFDVLWNATAEQICDRFVSELTKGLGEVPASDPPVRAGFIKIALEADWDRCPRNCMDAAAASAQLTGALLEIHTEKGALAERACTFFEASGLSCRQLVLCHMDKRPDVGLHKALADTGVSLEYDTFYRPKYDPSQRLWPLLEKMVAAGYADRIVLATDMAEAPLYRNIGGGPGLASFPGEIRAQLGMRGFTQLEQQQLLGGNIARRLAGLQ